MKALTLGAALAALCIAAPAAAAVPLNAGFETGDLSGWTAAGGVSVVTESSDIFQLETFTAPEGAYFAELVAGEVPDLYTTLSQSFSFGKASNVSFSANFVAYDVFDFNDDAYVRIFNQTTNAYVFQSDVQTVGDNAWTGWRTFSIGLAAGDYTLEAGVRNVGEVDFADTAYSSRLLLDDLQVAAVPEPAAWVMMIGGFGLAGAAMRRRRALALA